MIGADQAITIDEALKAITIHAARQIGLEDSIGTLEPGKEADLTILESDPYKVSPDAIADIKVSETWVAGERKFAAARRAKLSGCGERNLRARATLSV